MSVAGFFIGLVLAVIFYLVATALVAFAHSALIFGLIALCIWAAFTFGWAGWYGRRGGRGNVVP
jgi:hypothetical protein